MKLHEELLVLVSKEKLVGAQIIEKLQCMESGRQYLTLGYSSLFDYLVRGLQYSESAAYQKQSCVRLSNEIPELKAKLNSGQLTPSGISMAFKILKAKPIQEKREILKQLENQPTREIKKILSDLEGAPPIKVQKTEYSDKVIVRLELSKSQNQKLEKLKALRAHQGDLSLLFENLIDQALKKFDNTKFKPSHTNNPRFISQSLRNYIMKNANYRCQQPGCESTHYLQVDHIVPLRNNGKSSVDNLQILCAAHNQAKA